MSASGSAASAPPLVLVTGGSGYLAGWLIIALLNGGYSVRATLRDLSKEAKVRAAVAEHAAAAPADRLSFTQADLMSDAGWEAAVAGCRFVQHIASPIGVPGAGVALVEPAREGVLRVLRASVKAGVQRVVVTSSIAACLPPGPRTGEPLTADESCWTDLKQTLGVDEYVRSKVLAEQAAWDFIQQQQQAGCSTTLVTVLPGMCLGPLLGGEYAESVSIVRRLLQGQMPGMPRLGFSYVDARDVMRLHVLVMEAPQASGRYLATSNFLWMSEVADVLRARLPAAATAKVPRRAIPDWLLQLLAWFRSDAAFMSIRLGLKRVYVTSKAEALGWKARPSEEAVTAAAQSFIASWQTAQ